MRRMSQAHIYETFILWSPMHVLHTKKLESSMVRKDSDLEGHYSYLISRREVTRLTKEVLWLPDRATESAF